MKVLHVSTFETDGGAAIAAKRLSFALSKYCDSSMFVMIKTTPDKNVVGPTTSLSLFLNKLLMYADMLPSRLFVRNKKIHYSLNWIPERNIEHINALKPDIVNLHWVGNGFIRPESLAKIKGKIVWTFHDLWPLIGAEHHSDHMDEALCGYKSDHFFSLNKWMWKRKQHSWSGINITIVTPSIWLYKLAKKSSLFQNKLIQRIPNGIPVQVFKKKKRILLRKKYNIDTSKKVLLFIAFNSITDTNKGLDLLLSSLNLLKNKNDYILAIVASSEYNLSTSFPHIFLKPTYDEAIISEYYSVSDLTLVPSRKENLPYVAIESLACSVPVVCFKTGGLPDIVINKKNGYTAECYDTLDFKSGIEWCLLPSNYKILQESARSNAVATFDINHVAHKYHSLYKSLLSSKRNECMISVITPSFNQGKFLRDTLKSIISQRNSSKYLEYIIIDAKSKDNTSSIIREFSSKIKANTLRYKFLCEKDRGQADGINKGWKIAKGNILSFLNSDDYYEPNVLDRVHQYFEENKNVMWAYGGWNLVNREGNIFSTVLPKSFSKSRLLNYSYIGQPSCFFRSDLLRECGNLNINLNLAMDYDLWLRFSQKYEPGIMPFVISNMRYYHEAKSGARTKEQLREVLSLSIQYTRPLSYRRFMQYFYYLRGLLVSTIQMDITHRINRR